jgi:prepilin-type N-terminal cleavage/methylation domain-containing protein
MTACPTPACKRKTIRIRGFTLIELLVVIAIIALLSGLLFPALKNSLENSRVTACAFNLKNIGQALYIYADDNNSLLPPFENNGTTWDSVLLPNLGSETRIFLCPSDPYIDRFETVKRPRSYAVNGGQKYLAGDFPFGSFNGQGPLLLEHLQSRSGKTILVGERPGSSKADRGYSGEFPFCTLDQVPGAVHRSGHGSNYLFSDSSVMFLSVADAALSAEHDYWYVY